MVDVYFPLLWNIGRTTVYLLRAERADWCWELLLLLSIDRPTTRRLPELSTSGSAAIRATKMSLF